MVTIVILLLIPEVKFLLSTQIFCRARRERTFLSRVVKSHKLGQNIDLCDTTGPKLLTHLWMSRKMIV